MRKLYLLLLISAFGKIISAQTYYPLLDSAINEWSYTTHMLGVRLSASTQSGPCSYPYVSYSSFKQYTTADTLIDTLVYKPVMNSDYLCTMGYIREDTAARKVYFLDNLSVSEKVLYDFSMQVGDTMTINFIAGGGYVSGLYTLDSIAPVTIQAGIRNEFYLHCHSNPGSPVLTWVESVGNLNDLLYPYFDNDNYAAGYFGSCPGVQHQFVQFMICFDHASRVYYDACSLNLSQNNPCCATYTDTCDYYSFIGGIDESSTLSSMNIFPNPSNGKTTFSIDIKQSADFKLIVRDISGKKIIKEISLGKLDAGEKNIELDLSSLTNGFYLVELKTAEGSVFKKLLIEQ